MRSASDGQWLAVTHANVHTSTCMLVRPQLDEQITTNLHGQHRGEHTYALQGHHRGGAALLIFVFRVCCGRLRHSVGKWWTVFNMSRLEQLSTLMRKIATILRGCGDLVVPNSTWVSGEGCYSEVFYR